MTILLTAVGLPACQRKAAPLPAAESRTGLSDPELRASLAGLEPRLSALNERFALLGKQLETFPPDLPGFAELRAKFYATDEGKGVMGPKLSWLSARLDSAEKTRKHDELEQLSKDITRTYGELAQIDRISLELLHRVLHLQSLAKADRDEK